MLPVYVLQVILFLLQLEDMTDEELLQAFVGKVNAQLLKAEGEAPGHHIFIINHFNSYGTLEHKTSLKCQLFKTEIHTSSES